MTPLQGNSTHRLTAGDDRFTLFTYERKNSGLRLRPLSGGRSGRLLDAEAGPVAGGHRAGPVSPLREQGAGALRRGRGRVPAADPVPAPGARGADPRGALPDRGGRLPGVRPAAPALLRGAVPGGGS